MTTREMFRQMLSERRRFQKGSAEWEWRTAAARKYAWIMRGVPVDRWSS